MLLDSLVHFLGYLTGDPDLLDHDVAAVFGDDFRQSLSRRLVPRHVDEMPGVSPDLLVLLERQLYDLQAGRVGALAKEGDAVAHLEFARGVADTLVRRPKGRVVPRDALGACLACHPLSIAAGHVVKRCGAEQEAGLGRPPMRLEGFEPPTNGLEGRESQFENRC